METVPEQDQQSSQDDDVRTFNEVEFLRYQLSEAHKTLAEKRFEEERIREQDRREYEKTINDRSNRVEMVKLAKEQLSENVRSKPADERDISAADIKTFADELIEYLNRE